jgi:hypothetical protein
LARDWAFAALSGSQQPDVHRGSGIPGRPRLRSCTSICNGWDDPREIDDLGLEEIGADAVLSIEWADRLPRPPLKPFAFASSTPGKKSGGSRQPELPIAD